MFKIALVVERYFRRLNCCGVHPAQIETEQANYSQGLIDIIDITISKMDLEGADCEQN